MNYRIVNSRPSYWTRRGRIHFSQATEEIGQGTRREPTYPRSPLRCNQATSTTVSRLGHSDGHRPATASDQAKTSPAHSSRLQSSPRKYKFCLKPLPPTDDVNLEPDIGIPGLTVLLNESGCIRKTIWGVAVVFCIAFCFVQVRRQVTEYLEVPITTDVNIFRDETPLFPAVTICPYYPFRYNRLLQGRLQAVTPSSSNLAFPFFSLLQLPGENVTTLWQYGHVGEGDEKTFLLCKKFNTETNCHLKVVRKEFVTYLGICTSYTLSDRIHYDGAYNGLHIYYYRHDNTGRLHYTLIFHHPDEDPTHFLYKDSGVFIESFVRTYIVYSRQTFRNTNIPRHPCLPRKQSIQCYSKCVEQAISGNVTCRLPYMTSSPLHLCTTPESADHTYGVTLQVYRRMDGFCGHCPRKCEDDMYRTDDTIVLQLNFTVLTIHMVDNVVQVVTEMTLYTFDKLLSDIGGMLGLFMGVCLLTGLQITEALFVRIKLKLKR